MEWFFRLAALGNGIPLRAHRLENRLACFKFKFLWFLQHLSVPHQAAACSSSQHLNFLVMSPEVKTLLLGDHKVDLLLDGCRTDLSPVRAERITQLVRSGVNWEGVCWWARTNGVLPLLFAQLNAVCPADVPVPHFEQLRQEAQAISLRNLRLTGELIRMAGKLEAAGIRAMPFKGPALACLAYRNLAARSFNDLDVIVRKADIPKAKAILLGEGYQARAPFAETPVGEPWEAEYNAWNFDHPEKGITFDLHWTITSEHFSFPFDLDQCWGRAIPVSVGGTTLSTLCPEDYLLALCAHGYTHHWKKLAWVCDLAELIRATKKLNWGELMTRARACRAERMLLLGLRLAADLLGAELPDRIRASLEADAAARTLALQVRGWLFDESDGWRTTLQKRLLLLRAREGCRDRFQVLRHMVLTPNERDRAFLSLPRSCGFLYYLVRPVRLLVGFVARFLR